ncbi:MULTISPECIES: hydrogenase maturation protease [Desulfosediminicola]|uniref:hydrogenase maturation protease n=1 Tax=Desulfosediminicola TaxID=2886823 RepID=UPI0010AC6AC8|nr:hydrogenase maturation protease [Desulfosediminicola ganghwensis]
MATATVLCIGNSIAGDDGAGAAVYEELRERQLPADVHLKFLGLGGIDLLEELAGEEVLVVVDAVQLGADCGTVHVLAWEQLPGMTERPVSGHGIGVKEAIEVGRKLYPERMPHTIWLVGIEGQCFDQLGEKLSESVAASIPVAADEVLQLLT